MSQGIRSVAFLLSFLLHGGLGAFLWSLHGGGRELTFGIVEVFPASEAVPGPAPRHLSPQPPMAAARPPIPLPVRPLLPTFLDPMAASDNPSTPQPSSEAAVALAPLPGSKEEEANPGPGLPGGKHEIVSDGISSSGITGALILPGGGYQVRPAYPRTAWRMGIEGTSVLKVRILEDGSIGEVTVAQSAGHASLDQAAVDAVQRWRFEPARRGGHPVALWVTLPIRFRLE